MKKRFEVTGMSCAACVSHVDKAVRNVKGVSNVNVNLLTNSMDVEYDNPSLESEIISSVQKEGYGAYIKGQDIKAKDNNKDHALFDLIFAIVDLLILMYFSMGVMMWSWPTFKVFSMEENPMGFALIQFILVLPIVYIYRKYFVSGFKKLFKGQPNMDSLIAIGASFSLIYGIYCLFMISLGHNEYHMYLYFESAGMILTMVSIGKYLEGLSKKKTTTALNKLMDLAPKFAKVEVNGVEKQVPLDEVKIGDIINVYQGDNIPVDGIIISGNGSVNQSNITGESIPVYKQNNEQVYASTTLSSGFIKIKAEKVGNDTSFALICKLVEEASNSKAPVSRLADKISGIFVPVILSIALVTFIVNFIISKDFQIALNFALTVVVIACPCALGLATPVAIMVGTGKGAENGLLIKNAAILEKASHIKTVVFDKTGTITEGNPSVCDYINLTDEDYAPIIYSLENKSSHPLAKALKEFFISKEENIDDFKTIEGQGIKGTYLGHNYYLGNEKYFSSLDEKVKTQVEELSKLGKTVLLLAKDEEVVSLIAIKDQVKVSSSSAIKLLNEMGITSVMLTGDNQKVGEIIAKEVGLTKVIGNVLPQDKQSYINSLKSDDKHLVAMVGDGVNDAPALASADLGIALGSGNDVALDSSDIVLLRNDLLDVVNVINLSKRVLNTIKVGLFWAFFYNFICVFLACGILYYVNGFMMSPMIGSIAMSLSSVSVVLNALTINLFKVKKNEQKQTIKKEEKKIMEKEVVLNVEGMMCMHCVKHVEDALKKVSGVKDAKADLDKKNATVKCLDSTKKEDLIKAVVDAGYEAK